MLSDNNHAKEIRILKAELAKKKTLFSGLYQDFREGILTQDDYASTREILVRDIERLEKQLSELSAVKRKIQGRHRQKRNWLHGEPHQRKPENPKQSRKACAAGRMVYP